MLPSSKSLHFLAMPLTSFLAIMLLTSPTGEAKEKIKAEPMTLKVTLLNSSMIAHVEEMLRMQEVCSGPTATGCDNKLLVDKDWPVQLFESASANSRQVGELLITASSKGEFFLTYKNPKGQTTGFMPDEYDSDWGYGPYFNQTVVRRDGSWLLLPKSPFPKAVWINLTLPPGKGLGLKAADADALISPAFDAGSIYTLRTSLNAQQSKTKKQELFAPQSSIYIEAIRAGKVIFRKETEADMACGEEVKESKTKPLFYEAPFKDFLDANGHVALHTKYTRGC